jgi:ABC-type antimicrobial peptide transport system permease subunit
MSAIGKLIYFPEIDARNRFVPFPQVLPRTQGVEIVGIVRDAKYDNLREPPQRMAYLPMSQSTRGLGQIHIRTAGDPNPVAAAIPAIVRDVDQSLKVRTIRTLDAEIDRTLGQERLITSLLGFFGTLALLLACVGLYGVMAFAVAGRTSEIGIRMALGAERTGVLAMILRETLMLVVIGVALGIPAALASTHLLASVLFGVTPNDPATIAGTTLLMLAVAACAGFIPARRAAAVDPMVALRCE